MNASIEQAVALHRAGRLAEAERAYREVLRAEPRNPDALHLLGALLHQQGDHARSAELIGRAIALNPTSPVFHYNLGNSERALGRSDAALAAYRRELELNPGFAKARRNLAALAINHGGALILRGEATRAEALLRESLALGESAEALESLALLLTGLDRFDEAFALYERALALQPLRMATWRNILPAVLYHPTFDNPTRFAWHERFASAARAAAGPLPAPATPRSPDGRLRIGWLSSDFRAHPVARNLEPIFAHRDRSRFSACLYGDVAHPDSTTERLRRNADLWRQINGMSDSEVAGLIRADGIDVLVIAAGHFDDNRLTVALQRAAPVQVALHDAATSGLAELDYLIADRAQVPRRTTERFAERVVRVPCTYLHGAMPALETKRSDGPPAFGCFGNPSKINGATLALWAEIMTRLPEWRLTLRYRDAYRSAELRARIETALAARGVAPARLTFESRVHSAESHLAAYNDIDIALDTAPFNGATTTFEALWMGVPVVTLRGDAMAGCLTASILTGIRRSDLIADTRDDYVALALRLAAQRDDLARSRENLRKSVQNSSLCDGRGGARRMERVLAALWRRRARAAA